MASHPHRSGISRESVPEAPGRSANYRSSHFWTQFSVLLPRQQPPPHSLYNSSFEQSSLPRSAMANTSQLWSAPPPAQSTQQGSVDEAFLDSITRPFTSGDDEALTRPAPMPSAPQFHKVYRLKCAHCSLFFTDRGMKAVLLLRPHISLYSTDALPLNCSSPPRSVQPYNASPPPPRSCDCLTQSLHCHGCGCAVGYAIVMPCSRCSSSASAQSTANGHRFVFHHTEIVATERLYVKGEPDVIPYHPTYPFVRPSRSSAFRPHDRLDPITATPMPDSDVEDEFEDPENKYPSPSSSPYPQVRLNGDSSRGTSQPTVNNIHLKHGDNLWWHNLTRVGDLPGVNPRPPPELEDPMVRLRRTMPCLR